METTITLLSRRGGKVWQVEHFYGMVEFGSLDAAVRWIMSDLLRSDQMLIRWPDTKPEDRI